jgi:hypothetical protein
MHARGTLACKHTRALVFVCILKDRNSIREGEVGFEGGQAEPGSRRPERCENKHHQLNSRDYGWGGRIEGGGGEASIISYLGLVDGDDGRLLCEL